MCSNSANLANFGSSNRLIYDNCAYQKKLYESTSPLAYMLYDGKMESCDKCTYEGQFWRPYDLVDVESELKNITRANSKCPQYKYNPNCKRSKYCLSTYDKTAPVVLAPEVCPIVFNNIVKMKTPGYDMPKQEFCGKATGMYDPLRNQ
jgi:hypothetical protein